MLPPPLTDPSPGAQWLNQLRSHIENLVVTGSDEIRVHKTPHGFIVGQRPGGGNIGGGDLIWRGEYNANETYNIGDIVIVGFQDYDDIPDATGVKIKLKDGTRCGTFILMNKADDGTVPAPTEPNAFRTDNKPIWQTFSRACWPALAVTKEAVAPGSETTRAVVIDEADCKTPAGTPKTLRIREVQVCHNNEVRRALVIMSEPYTVGT